MYKTKTMDTLSNDVAYSLQHHLLIRAAKARIIASSLSTKDLLLFKKYLPSYKDYALRKIKTYHELTTFYHSNRTPAGELEIIRNILAYPSDQAYAEAFPTVSVEFSKFILADFYPRFLVLADVVRVFECGPKAAFDILHNMPEQAREELAADLSYIHNRKYLLFDDKQIATDLYSILAPRIDNPTIPYRIYQRRIINETRIFNKFPERVKNILLLTLREEAIVTLLKKQWQINPIMGLKFLELTDVESDKIMDYFRLVKQECIAMVIAGSKVKYIQEKLLALKSPVEGLSSELYKKIFNLRYISELVRADYALVNIMLMTPQKRKDLLFNTDVEPAKIYDVCVSIKNFALRIIQGTYRTRDQISKALKEWRPELSLELPEIPPLSLHYNIRSETLHEQFITETFVEILMKLPGIYAFNVPTMSSERLMADNRNADEVYRALITDSDPPMLSLQDTRFLRSPTPLISSLPTHADEPVNIYYLSLAILILMLLLLIFKLKPVSGNTSPIAREIAQLPKPKFYVNFLTDDEIEAFKSFLTGLPDCAERYSLQKKLQQYQEYIASQDSLSTDVIPDIEDPITIDALYHAITAQDNLEDEDDEELLLTRVERRWIKTYAYDYLTKLIDTYKGFEYFLEPETRDKIVRDKYSTLNIYRDFSRAAIEFVHTVREILADKNLKVIITIKPSDSLSATEISSEEETSTMSLSATYHERLPRYRA